MDQLGRAQGFECRNCGMQFDTTTREPICPDCGGLFGVRWEVVEPDRTRLEDRGDSMWVFDDLLPFERDVAVSLGEGRTPVVSSPDLAASAGVGELLIKDESQNPTGSVVDREMSLAVTAATQGEAAYGTLAAPGAAGQSFGAYAARAGLDGSLYLPARATFEQKAMANVHDIDLTVVRGRFEDTKAPLQEERARNPTTVPLGAFESPWRHLGAMTIAFEIATTRRNAVPDAVVVPTGTGSTIVGIYEGFQMLEDFDVIQKIPALVAVQAAGCSPIVDAVHSGDPIEPIETPDTLCGELEVPYPNGGSWVREAVEKTDGTAVAVPDDKILDEGVGVARRTGLELSPDAAAGPAGAVSLAEEGWFGKSDQIIVVGTGTGGADLLRNHLTGSEK